MTVCVNKYIQKIFSHFRSLRCRNNHKKHFFIRNFASYLAQYDSMRQEKLQRFFPGRVRERYGSDTSIICFFQKLKKCWVMRKNDI